MKKISLKNIQDGLSRSEMRSIKAGSGDGAGNLCHFHYTGTLWGSYTITYWGNGSCHGGNGQCYEYRATGSCKI